MATTDTKRANQAVKESLNPTVRKIMESMFGFINPIGTEATEKLLDIYTEPTKITGDPATDSALNEVTNMLPGANVAVLPGQGLRQISRIPGWRKYLLEHQDEFQALKRAFRGAKETLKKVTSFNPFNAIERATLPNTVGALYTLPARSRGREAYDIILRDIEEMQKMKKNPVVAAIHEPAHIEDLAIQGAKRSKYLSKTEQEMEDYLLGKVSNKWNQPLSLGERYPETRGREAVEGITPESNFIRELHPGIAKRLDEVQELSRRENEAYELAKGAIRGKKKLPEYVAPIDVAIAQKFGAKSKDEIVDIVAQDRIRNALVAGDREGALEWARKIWLDANDKTKQRIADMMAFKGGVEGMPQFSKSLAGQVEEAFKAASVGKATGATFEIGGKTPAMWKGKGGYVVSVKSKEVDPTKMNLAEFNKFTSEAQANKLAREFPELKGGIYAEHGEAPFGSYDLNLLYKNKAKATELAKRFNQRSIWDDFKKEVVEIGGTGKTPADITSDEIRQVIKGKAYIDAEGTLMKVNPEGIPVPLRGKK